MMQERKPLSSRQRLPNKVTRSLPLLETRKTAVLKRMRGRVRQSLY
jgi:hypothetical protein